MSFKWRSSKDSKLAIQPYIIDTLIDDNTSENRSTLRTIQEIEQALDGHDRKLEDILEESIKIGIRAKYFDDYSIEEIGNIYKSALNTISTDDDHDKKSERLANMVETTIKNPERFAKKSPTSARKFKDIPLHEVERIGIPDEYFKNASIELDFNENGVENKNDKITIRHDSYGLIANFDDNIRKELEKEIKEVKDIENPNDIRGIRDLINYLTDRGMFRTYLHMHSIELENRKSDSKHFEDFKKIYEEVYSLYDPEIKAINFKAPEYWFEVNFEVNPGLEEYVEKLF